MVGRGARERILGSAEALILRGGYHGTGTNAIIADASVSKGSFFYHFPDKLSLLKALLENYAEERLRVPLERCVKAHPDDPKGVLIGFVDEREVFYERDGFEGGCFLGNMALEVSDREPVFRVMMASIFEAWRGVILRILEGAEMRMDKDHFTTLYIGAMEGVTMQVRVHKDGEKAKWEWEAVRSLVEMVFFESEER